MPMRRFTSDEQRAIEERQRQEIEGGDTTYVMTRLEDRSIWIRSGAFFEKYKILFYIITGILLALGFDFKTPRQFYAELQQRVDQQTIEVKQAQRKADTLSRKIDVLITFKCLEQDSRDMTIAGLDCSKYLNSNNVRLK